ncbi:MAG: thioredoxin-dependent thiol peroxidase [Acidimicrobiales bacterium]
MVTRLEVGDKAPTFSLLDQDNQKVALKDLKGKPAVVYFYPADDTPGCTKEACQFNENLTTFNRAGIKVIGISPDGAVKHQRFREKYALKFPLVSDPEHTVMEAFGAWGEKTMYGKKTVGVIRSTFLLDEKGVIAKAWYNVRADGHAAKVLEEARSQK